MRTWAAVSTLQRMKSTAESPLPSPDRPSGKVRRLPVASSAAQDGRQTPNPLANQAHHPGLISLVQLLATQAAREAVRADVDAAATKQLHGPIHNSSPLPKGP